MQREEESVSKSTTGDKRKDYVRVVAQQHVATVIMHASQRTNEQATAHCVPPTSAPNQLPNRQHRIPTQPTLLPLPTPAVPTERRHFILVMYYSILQMDGYPPLPASPCLSRLPLFQPSLQPPHQMIIEVVGVLVEQPRHHVGRGGRHARRVASDGGDPEAGGLVVRDQPQVLPARVCECVCE